MNKDLLAKLLASENIDIIHSNVRTASFDIKSRTLTMPQWQDMSPQVEMMLLAHEISHALFTNLDLCLDDSSPMVYRNVIEDVRVEKKIQKMFPGLRKDFIAGYKELNQNNFFGVKGSDLSKLNLIDRINLYFKAGSTCGVKFTSVEMAYVNKTNACDTYQDVIDLSAEIYQFMKDDYLAQKDKESTTMTDYEEEEEDEYDDDDYTDYGLDDSAGNAGEEKDNESDDNEGYSESEDGDGEEGEEDSSSESEDDSDEEESEMDGNTAGNKEYTEETPNKPYSDSEMDKALESKTQENFDSTLDQLADVNTIIQNHTTDINKEAPCPIVPYKEILEKLSFVAKDNYMPDQTASIQKWKDSSNKYVNYLVKEFEMKKSASRYARTVTSKTGSLNIQKLYAHKLTDDMFKSITTVSDDKNHGMIFLLDWSGSMVNVMEDTLKQVINLATFCKRSSIKFQVLAFTSGYHLGSERNCGNSNKTITSGDYKLMELFSSKMSTSEFTKMTNMILTKPWYYAASFRLGYTPLNSALMYMVDYLGEYIRVNNIQKASLVTLTDGASDRMEINSDSGPYNTNTIHKIWSSKKSYIFPKDNLYQTRLLINIIKEKYNIPVIGFFVGKTDKRGIFNFMNTNVEGRYYFEMFNEIRASIRKDNVYVYHYSPYDELYFIPDSKAKEETDLGITDKMSNSAAAKSFGKFLNQGKSSQVLLNRFISVVC